MALKRSVHFYVLMVVVAVIYAAASLTIVGVVVPKALRAADDFSNLSGFLLLLVWGVVSFYLGREVYRLLNLTSKRN